MSEIYIIFRTVACVRRMQHFSDKQGSPRNQRDPSRGLVRTKQPEAINEASARSRHCSLVMAHGNSGLRCCQSQDRLIIQIVQASCLGGLKIDPGFAAERGVDDDPLQITVSLKANAQCFARSCVEISWRARSSRSYTLAGFRSAVGPNDLALPLPRWYWHRLPAGGQDRRRSLHTPVPESESSVSATLLPVFPEPWPVGPQWSLRPAHHSPSL
jgi:hypothetical protein